MPSSRSWNDCKLPSSPDVDYVVHGLLLATFTDSCRNDSWSLGSLCILIGVHVHANCVISRNVVWAYWLDSITAHCAAFVVQFWAWTANEISWFWHLCLHVRNICYSVTVLMCLHFSCVQESYVGNWLIRCNLIIIIIITTLFQSQSNHYEGQQVHIIYIQNQCWHACQNNQSQTTRFSTGISCQHKRRYAVTSTAAVTL